jgi:hypothetical protein
MPTANATADPAITAEAVAGHLAALDGDEAATFLRQARILAANRVPSDALEARARKAAQGKFARPRPASEIETQAIDWLWKGYLPLGALSLLYGPEGDGKSTLTMMLAAMVTRGTLPGALYGSQAAVEIVAYEDDPGAVIVPRLEAHDADLSRVFIHGDDAGDALLTLPDDVSAFGSALEDRGSKLVVIDPLPDALREGLKDNNNGDVRTGIVPLHNMAQRLGIAVLGVTHPNKGATDAANKVMGSKAWRSVPRSVLLYGRDPDDVSGPTRIVAVSKANYAAKAASRVRVESVGDQPRATLDGESSYTDADLLLANAGTGRGQPLPETQVERAEKLLYRLLEDGGGEVAAEVAYVAGEADGISRSSMQRARRSIGADGGRTWKLTGLGL